jgi:hypothetical protein
VQFLVALGGGDFAGLFRLFVIAMFVRTHDGVNLEDGAFLYELFAVILIGCMGEELQ